jgi:hypothetical protein
MHEEDPTVAQVESPPRLECKGIWGGIRNRNIEITAGKVKGSIYSTACCEGGKEETSTTLEFVKVTSLLD